MQVKKAVFSDAKEISEIVEKEFSYFNPTAEKISARLKNEKFRILKIESGKDFAGIIDLQLLDENIGRINGLAVKEEFRGKNFGKKLLNAGIDFFIEKNVEKILLLVSKDNEIAKKLYKEFGFEFAREHSKVIAGKKVEEFELRLKNEMPSCVS